MLIALLAVPIALLAWFLWEKRQRRTYPMAGGLHADIDLPYDSEYELYHNGLSLCSKKVRVCLKELGIEFTEHHVDLIETGSYEVVSRAFLRVNPAGLLPVLVHRGHPVYESHDIIRYCAEQGGSADVELIPADPKLRALMDIWMERASLKGDDPAKGLALSAANCAAILTVPLFCAGMEEIPLRKLAEGLLFHRIKSRPLLFLLFKLRGLRRLPTIPPLKKILHRAQLELAVHLDALEQQLQDRQWICGQQYSLADVSWMVIFERLAEADWLAGAVNPELRPALWNYWQRLQQRPGYAGIADYRLSSVGRATARIQSEKHSNPNFLPTIASAESTDHAITQ